jgi:hypothetical protein
MSPRWRANSPGPTLGRLRDLQVVLPRFVSEIIEDLYTGWLLLIRDVRSAGSEILELGGFSYNCLRSRYYSQMDRARYTDPTYEVQSS